MKQKGHRKLVPLFRVLSPLILEICVQIPLKQRPQTITQKPLKRREKYPFLKQSDFSNLLDSLKIGMSLSTSVTLEQTSNISMAFKIKTSHVLPKFGKSDFFVRNM